MRNLENFAPTVRDLRGGDVTNKTTKYVCFLTNFQYTSFSGKGWEQHLQVVKLTVWRGETNCDKREGL